MRLSFRGQDPRLVDPRLAELRLTKLEGADQRIPLAEAARLRDYSTPVGNATFNHAPRHARRDLPGDANGTRAQCAQHKGRSIAAIENHRRVVLRQERRDHSLMRSPSLRNAIDCPPMLPG